MRELDDWICGAFFKLSVHDACSLLYLFLLLSFLWVFQFLCHFLLSQIALAMAFVTWRDWAVQRVKLWTNRDTFKPVVEYALHAGHFGLWVSIRLDLSTTTKHVWSYETESCIEILSISFWCVACFFLFHHHIFLISCVLFFGLFHHLIRWNCRCWNCILPLFRLPPFISTHFPMRALHAMRAEWRTKNTRTHTNGVWLRAGKCWMWQKYRQNI